MIVPISGQVTGWQEALNVMRVAVGKHYGGGEYTRRFEKDFAHYMGARHAILCNSGSSANLLALAALELPKGSEVLTTAVNFPTTVNAIFQLGLKPVFIDSNSKTLNASAIDVMAGFGQKPAAAIFAHTLGNPMHIPFTEVPVIEDCCDAVGSTEFGNMVGQCGITSTVSFYPAHHMTMGEGGAVLTDSPRMKKVIESFRDWGRDCWCEPGEDNACGTRFKGDYDHKYTYSRVGYNLKATDLQAAVGLAQLSRLDGFIKRRIENWTYLRENLEGLPIEFVDAAPNSQPSWFGFAFLTPDRNKLANYLDKRGVANRPIMGGNLLRQPAYKNFREGDDYRVIGNLDGANKIHEQGIWVGVFPGITDVMREYQVKTIRSYFG